MTGKRVVVDSNVLISAVLSPANTSRKTLEAVIGDARLLFSEATFAELVTRLRRPKFDKWVSQEARLLFLEELAEFADFVDIDDEDLGCADPDDDKFLETARNGHAQTIITGDKDLLAMHPFGDIAIVTPSDWLNAQTT